MLTLISGLFVSEELVAPCIHDGLLAPDLQQRLRYERKLRVHGKSRVKVSKRQQDLIKAYKVCTGREDQ